MPECSVCSSPANNKCARCKCVFYCSPAHQKEDWPAHKVECPRLAQEALAAVFHPCDEELLLRITTCLAQNGYHKEVGIMVQLNKAFWTDEQIWDAYKDVPGPGGGTRLMYASMYGLLERAQWLLARGARTNTFTCTLGITALHFASGCGHLKVVRELCQRGANVNYTDNEGGTALYVASLMGHVDIVRKLCDRAANVNIDKTCHGSTPLMCATEMGHLGVVRVLCARGANVNTARIGDGFTALIIASQENHLELVRELAEKGAHVNAAINETGATALIMACERGHLEVVRELCARRANLNAARTDNAGTALMAASYCGHLEVARLLLKLGANKYAVSSTVNEPSGNFHTAYSLAKGPHLAALQALLIV